MTIEAMKQALEALDAGPNAYLLMNTGGIANKLRQAIAEAEKQEPVMGVEVKRIASGGFIGNVWWIHENLQEGVFHLYTHPKSKHQCDMGVMCIECPDAQPKREPPTPREVKDTLRATGLLTNSQAWDVAEEVMKLLAAHGIKENT